MGELEYGKPIRNRVAQCRGRVAACGRPRRRGRDRGWAAGKIFRVWQPRARRNGIGRDGATTWGCATVLNALALQDALEKAQGRRDGAGLQTAIPTLRGQKP